MVFRQADEAAGLRDAARRILSVAERRVVRNTSLERGVEMAGSGIDKQGIRKLQQALEAEFAKRPIRIPVEM